MAATQLRLRGITPMHAAAAVMAAAPLGFTAWTAWVRKLSLVELVSSQPMLVGAALLVAVIPWMSRALARTLYRAKVDDLAVYVRGDALPWRAIKAARVERSARRTLLRLQRSETIELVIVLADLYAGRLQPVSALRDKLAQHGHPVDL